MRNLQYEKKTDKKMYNTGTMTKYIYYLFKWDRRYASSTVGIICKTCETALAL